MMIMMGVFVFFSSLEKPVLIPVDMLDFSYVAFQGTKALEGMKGLVILSVYGVILHGLVLIVRFYRSGNRAARPILIGALLFFLCGLNDTLIETQVYAFVYLAEYGGLFLILGMANALINQMVKINQDMSQIKILSAIGKMATEVVHDLTAPLDAIKLAASIAKKDGNGSDTQKKYLSMIEDETKRLSDLSFDILQFVNNDGALAKQSVDLNDYIHDVFLLLQGDFIKHRIGFRYTLDYDGPVYLDPHAFKRIIINLATNARESLVNHPEGNQPPEFVLGSYKQAKHIIFTFSDNGPGISECIKPHIFEPFTTYGKTFGSGLGLAISKQIVDRHGGTISCESDKNYGTTIRVTLPAQS